jgi:curved DNA-binding protein CbpA
MSQREQTNYYEILEVTPDAAATEIHKAYQRARQTYSQDNPALYSMFSPEEARELLRLIDEAYNVLGNQATRKSYDDSLGGRGGAPGTSAVPTHAPTLSAVSSGHMSAHSSSSTSSQTSSHSRQQAATLSVAPSRAPETHSSSNTPPPLSAHSGEGSDDFVVKRRDLQKAAAPSGQGRTLLSTYKLDDSFESEIQAATEFDGGFIQRVRLYKNISIDKMSEATRISRPYLMAVETNDYKSLPAAVFVRGFVVQAARQLGLDETKVAASYMKLFKAGGGK